MKRRPWWRQGGGVRGNYDHTGKGTTGQRINVLGMVRHSRSTGIKRGWQTEIGIQDTTKWMNNLQGGGRVVKVVTA